MSDISDVKSQFDSFRTHYEKVRGMLDMFKRDKESTELKVSVMQDDVDYLNHAAMIMEKFIRESNAEALQELEDTLNDGIEANFPDFESRLEIEYKVTPSTQRIIFRFKKGEYYEKVKDSQSGGMLDVVSLLSRVVFIVQKKWRPLIALDEALNGVSVREDEDDYPYAQLTSSLLKTITETQGFDILLNTHKDELTEQAKTKYKISKYMDSDGFSASSLERISR